MPVTVGQLKGTTMTQPPGSGWFSDPEGVPNQLRWWDGRQWTSATQPTPVSVTPGPEPKPAESAPQITREIPALELAATESNEPRKKSNKVILGAIAVGVVVIFIGIAATIGGKDGGTETATAATTQAQETTPTITTRSASALSDDVVDQAGVACVAALGPKVDQEKPEIRNHVTRSVNDTFVTVGQVSKYVSGEAPYNYQFECTTRFDGTFKSEVTYFKELARTRLSTESAAPSPTTQATTTTYNPADDPEFLFLGTLTLIGFPDTGRTKKLEAGRTACASFRKGEEFTDIALMTYFNGPDEWTPENAGQLVGAAVSAFCPQFKSELPR